LIFEHKRSENFVGQQLALGTLAAQKNVASDHQYICVPPALKYQTAGKSEQGRTECSTER
jgi:hypothetical protein